MGEDHERSLEHHSQPSLPDVSANPHHTGANAEGQARGSSCEWRFAGFAGTKGLNANMSEGEELDLEHRIEELEASFRRDGLPNLAEHYTASEDVFTRALPFLSLVFLVEVLNALNLTWTWWQNALALLGGLAVLIGVTGALNRLRGRPFLSLPRTVGVPEMGAFVLVPPVLPLLFGGQWRSALVTLAAQLLLLGVTYTWIKFGVFSIVRWAGARFVTQLRASFSVLVRAIPLLLFFALVTFFTNEYWQMFGKAHDALFATALILFIALTALFLLVQAPKGVRGLEREIDLAGRPLRPAQRVNVGLVIFVSQVLQVTFVGLAVWLFFVVFGGVLVNASIRASWMGTPGHVLWRIPFPGHNQIQITRELLRVST